MTSGLRVTCIAALCVVMTLIASGCSRDEPSGTSAMMRHTLVHDGLEREYFVFLPSTYGDGTHYPVTFFMHGYGGSATGTEAEVTNGLTKYAEEFGHVMVFPQSTWFMSENAAGERWEVTSWNHISDGFDTGPDGPICTEDAEVYPCPPECGTCGKCGWASCNDDVGFLKDLFTQVAKDLDVDTARFYVSGFSNGAMMANRIACEASQHVAAAALIGGRVEPGFECTPSTPVPLLQINGGRDTSVPHDGRVSESGYFYASTASIANHWNNGAACAASPRRWNPSVIDGHPVRCTIACASSKRESIDCIWSDGDHRWPGTPGTRGSNGYCVTELQSESMPEQTRCMAPDIDQEEWGSRLMFEFFEKH